MNSFRPFLLAELSLLALVACGTSEEPKLSRTQSNHLPSVSAVQLEGTPREKGTLKAVVEGWSDADGDPATYRFAWLVNGKPAASISGDKIDGTHFAKGDSVVVEVTPFDDHGDGAAIRSAAVVIENTPPQLDSAGIANTLYFTEDDISVTVGAWLDDDGDAVAYTYQWYVNDAPLTGEVGDTLSGAHFSKGDTVKVEVKPFDGETDGLPVFSNTVVVSNSAPSVVSAHLGTGPYTVGVTIPIGSITGWSDADGDPEDYQYAWFVDGMPAGGQFSASFDTSSVVKGQTVQAAVTPFDGEVTGPAVYTNIVTIANSPPTVSAVSLGAGPFYTDSTLNTAGIAADIDTADAPIIEYRWFVDGAIVAHTASSLPGSFFSKGQTVAVEMTPYDLTDYGTPVVSAPVTIQNTLPSISSVAIGAGPFRTNDTIHLVDVAGWTDPDDTDTEDYRYLWYKGAVSLPAQTGTSLDGATEFAKGDVIRLEITPLNGAEAGTPVFSNSVTIANTAPVAQTPTLSAGPYFADSTIVATGQSTDDDIETPTYDYRWYVANAVVPGATGPTLTGKFSRGQSVWVEARAYDQTDYSSYVSAVVGVIVNKPPEAHGFTLQPADVTAGTATLYVQVSTAAHDIDGDPVTVEYAWFKNDVDQGFPVAQTTVAGPFTPGDVWKVVATATDGQGGVTVSEQSEAVLFEADQVAMGFDFSCVSTTTGQLRCWGWNYSLQTGTNGGNVPTPVTLGWASAVSQVAAADYHACALLTSGAVKCWGDQYQGRLGNNVTFGPYIAEPQDVVGLGAGSGVVQISANYDHSCAVLNTGVVKCWGYNGTQQLGQSHSMQASGVPVSPSGITDAVSVTTGRYHSCAVRRNGKGVCWGYQYQGRLGNGSASNDYALNSEVAMSSNLASIAASDRHSCAVTTDGALYCWGYNYDGAVGVNQQYVEFSTPQQIFPSGVAAVATGDRYTCAAKTDGTVWCWGHNFDNAAGVSTYGTLLTPRQTSLTDVVRLDAGNRHNCAVLQTGSLRCWGSNISYALGDGSSDSNGSYLGVTPIGFVP